jgi:hypothetical protein
MPYFLNFDYFYRLDNAELWVGIGLLLFFAILVAAGVPKLVAGALDAKAAKIQSELDEAARLVQRRLRAVTPPHKWNSARRAAGRAAPASPDRGGCCCARRAGMRLRASHEPGEAAAAPSHGRSED